jgi:hypothetical protein
LECVNGIFAVCESYLILLLFPAEMSVNVIGRIILEISGNAGDLQCG